MYQHSLRNPAGYVTGIENGKEFERDTHQCPHCDMHFDYVKGSGKTRGFCMLCTKITCGAQKCHEHFPMEERLDLFEAGRLQYLHSSRDQITPKRKIIL